MNKTPKKIEGLRVFARLIKSTVVLQAKDHVILTVYGKRYVDRFNASVTARYMDRNEMKDVLYTKKYILSTMIYAHASSSEMEDKSYIYIPTNFKIS